MTDGYDGRASAPGPAPITAGPERPRGTTVSGKYTLVRRLASGGMGDVYEARHQVLGRQFALKFIRPDLAGHEDLERRFRKEAETAGRLISEHITAVTDFDWEGPGRPYLVMELLDGWDLAQVLRAGPLPAETVVEIGIQVCRGLAVAHAHGFVHRDLKPANLFVCRRADRTFQVKILDFGIAKNARAASVEQTRPGDPVGSAHYMAPEQIRQSPTLDARADLYALGVVLYEALSGQRPRRGDSFYSVVSHGLNERPPSLEASARAVPPALATLVAKAMAYEPADRFSSALEMEQALASISTRSTRISWAAEPGPDPATGGSSPPAPALMVSSRPRRSAGWKWIAAGASAALVVGAAVLFDRSARQTLPADRTPAAAAPVTSDPVPPPASATARPEPPAAEPPTAPPPRRQAEPPRRTRKRARPAATRPSSPTPSPPRPAPATEEFDRQNPYR